MRANTIAPDAGEGLPTEVVGEYRASTTMAGRLRAMAIARAAPGSMRRLFDGLDLVHYPLTVPVPSTPTRLAITLHDVQHLDLPHLFRRSERAFRRLVAMGRVILPELYRILDTEDASYPSYDFWRMRNTFAVIGALAVVVVVLATVGCGDGEGAGPGPGWG